MNLNRISFTHVYFATLLPFSAGCGDEKTSRANQAHVP